jgi:hypothetical protein
MSRPLHVTGADSTGFYKIPQTPEVTVYYHNICSTVKITFDMDLARDFIAKNDWVLQYARENIHGNMQQSAGRQSPVDHSARSLHTSELCYSGTGRYRTICDP